MLERRGHTLRNNDSPEVLESQDLLNRSSFVRLIAAELQELDLSQGAVTAIVGPWGVGKSTLLKFIAPRFNAKHTVVEFNPWLFTSAEDLVIAFFKELVRELGKDKKQPRDVVHAMANYLEALQYLAFEPGLAALGLAAGAIKRITGRKPPSVVDAKNELTKALSVSDRRLVVTIDDLDRLHPREALEVLRLVRLVGSLPNVLYLLAYDEDRLIKALDSENVSGTEYLEKIVYITWRVPGVDLGSRRTLIYERIKQVLDARGQTLHLPDEDRLHQLVEQVLVPNLTTIRRIKRYFASVNLTLKEMSGDIDLCDLMNLEALRLYEKNVFDEIVRSAYSLAWSKDFLSLSNDKLKEQSKHAIKRMLGDVTAVNLEWVTKDLFPLAYNCYDSSFGPPNITELLNGNRVGHIAILLQYLDRFDSRELISRQKFGRILKYDVSVDENLRELEEGAFGESIDVLDLLLQNLDSVPVQKHLGLAVHFLELASHSESNPEVFRHWGFRSRARELANRIVLAVPDSGREPIETGVYDKLKSFEARFLFVYDLEHPTDEFGVSKTEAVTSRLRPRLFEEFTRLSAIQLEETNRLCWIANSLMNESKDEELAMPDFLSSPEAAWNLIASAVAIRPSHSMNRPDLEVLRNILGGEEALKGLLEFLAANRNAKNADPEILDFAIEDSRQQTGQES